MSKKAKYLTQVLYFILIMTHQLSGNPWKSIGCPRGLAPTNLYLDGNNRAFVGTHYHGLYYSDDLGLTWSSAKFNSDEEFMRVEDITSNNMGKHYASTIVGIYISEDSGENWDEIYPAYWDGRYHEIDILSDGTVFCWNCEEILRSIDIGITWEKIWDHNTEENLIREFTVSETQTIYIVGNDRDIYKSTDRGDTWSEIQLPINESDFIFFIGMIPTNNDSILYLSTFPRKYFYKISLFDSSYSILYQGYGNILDEMSPEGNILFNTYDTLFLYNTQTSALTSFITEDQIGRSIIDCAHFLWTNEETIIFSNWQYELYISTDKGLNWVPLSNDFPYRIPLALEVNEGRIIVGAHQSSFSGLNYYSDDYGKSWTKTNMWGKATEIESLGKSTIIAAGIGGLFISNDNGQTWKEKSEIGAVYAMYVSKSGSIFIGNSYHGVYKSTNNGKSWYSANNGYDNSYSFGFGQIESGRIFSGGWPVCTFYSDNDGSSWNNLEVYPFTHYRSYTFCGTRDTIIAGLSAGITLSCDGGENWDIVHYSNEGVRSVYEAPNGDYLALSQGEGVLLSTDNGRNWIPLNDSLNSLQVYDLEFDKNNLLYLASADGIYSNDMYVSSMPPLASPEYFSISPPYPNPFNGLITIKFSLNKSSSVDLKIYDITGRYITSLISDFLVSDDYQINWQPEYLSSGVYLLSLEIGTNCYTKKVLYLK